MINNIFLNMSIAGSYMPLYKSNPAESAFSIFDHYNVSKTSSKAKTRVKGGTDDSRVSYIINSDPDKYEIDETKMKNRIINAARYADISPLYIACIVKNESHFNDKIKNNKTGKGPMGLTSSPICDLYERPAFFDSKLGELVKKYGSLNKLFQAKKKNPSIALGNLGEILYKYNNASSLKSAVMSDFDLNLKVGAFVFKGYFKEQKNNLRNAFLRYNNCSSKNPKTGKTYKDEYADNAMKTYNSAIRNG